MKLLLLLSVLLMAGCSYLPTRVVYQDQKLSECVQAEGEYKLYQHYIDDEYYAVCEIPEKELWRIDIDSSLTTK